MKNKYLKWIGCGLSGMAVLLLIAAAAFYFFELKPRIDVVMAIGHAFADGSGDSEILELDLEDGQQILLDIGSDNRLDGIVHMEDAVYDGLEFGYTQEGILMRLSKVSNQYYLLPWTDDVREQIDESALVEMMGLDEEQKSSLGTGLLELRNQLLTEEEYEFKPTWLNRLLGLDCLKADILELYKAISFHKAGRQEINRGDEVLSCIKYELEIPEEYVKLLSKTDGAGQVLGMVGDILGDVSLDVYICQGTLVYIDIDTSFLYMPQLEWKNLINGRLDEVRFVPAALTGNISVNAEGDMEINAKLADDDMSIETALTWKLLPGDASWRYDSNEAINIFQAGAFRLLLEAKKWEDAINGESTD